MTSKQNCFAEVIESSLDNFLAQCWQWDFFPEFGSLIQVKSDDKLILGVVTQIQTGSMDPMRYPFAYQKTEDELIKEQPQIFEFLKTTFKVQILGYTIRSIHPEPDPIDDPRHISNKIFYHIPTKPCKIHTFIKNANKELSSIFFSNPNFLYMLFGYSNQIINLDELLITILKNQKFENALTAEKLSNFYKTFSMLTNNDYRRIKLFLRKIESL